MEKSNIRTIWVLSVIVAGGMVLRAWGIFWGLPFGYHPDENRIMNITMNFFTGDFNPHHFIYPTLFMYGLFLTFSLYFMFGTATGSVSGSDALIVKFFEDPAVFYTLGRSFSVVLGVLTLIVLFRLGRDAFSEKTGLLAAFLLSVTFLHVKHGHFATTEITLTLLIVAAYVFIFQIYSKGTARSYVMTGITAGLATSVKYTAGLLCLPILVAHLCRRGSTGVSIFSSLLDLRLLLSGALMIILFFIGSPYVALDFFSFLADFAEQIRHTREGYVDFFGTSVGYVFFIKEGLFYGMRLPLAIVCVFGVVLALFRPTKREAILLCFPIVYYLIIGTWGVKNNRYLLVIFPILLLYAAHLVEVALRYLKIGFIRRIGTVAILCLLAGPSLLRCCYEDYLMTQIPTQSLAKIWVEDHVPWGSTIIVEGFVPPPLSKDLLQLKEEARIQNRTYAIGNLRTEYLIATFRSEKPHYRVIRLVHEPTRFGKQLTLENEEIKCGDYFIIDGRLDRIIEQAGVKGEAVRLLHNFVRREGKLLSTITPYKQIRFVGHDLRIRDRLGPQLSIYKL